MISSYKKEILFFILLSFLNCILLGFDAIDLTFFFIRELFIIVFFIFKSYMQDVFEAMNQESEEIHRLVIRKEPKLRFYRYYFIILILAMLVSVNGSLGGTFLYTLSLWVIDIWFVVHLYYLYIISTIPEAAIKYNVYASIKKNGWRSFSTASSVGKVCKECAKGLFYGATAIYCTEKMVMGVQYRGPLLNEVAAPFNGGLKSTNEFVLATAKTVIEIDPASREKMVGPNGWLDTKKTFDVAATYGINSMKNAAFYSEPETRLKSFFKWFDKPKNQ